MNQYWKIIVVDDDNDIHDLTNMIFENFQFERKKIQFFNAHSAREAKEILSKEQDIAIAIFDVYMEESDSGMQLIHYLREELCNTDIRILLRTGRPDDTPLMNVIKFYDIDDYFVKGRDDSARLYASVLRSLRIYKLITELQKSNLNLEKNQGILKNLIEYAPDAIFTVDIAKFKIQELNQSALNYFGYNYDEILFSELTLIDAKGKELTNRIFEHFGKPEMLEISEYPFLKKSGEILYGEVRIIWMPFDNEKGSLARLSIIDRTSLREASELKKKQEAVIAQAERIKSLSNVSAGLAHEINQPLLGISLLTENLRSMVAKGHISNEVLERKTELILENVKRINKLIEHVRTFSNEQAQKQIEIFDINDSIRSALMLVGTQYKSSKISIRTNLSDYPLFVRGNRYQFEQIVLNFLSNSKDALQTKEDNPTIDCTTALIQNEIIFTVADNGVGINKDILDSVFDPFYTTKSVSAGTGLGLSISYGIVEQMGGKIIIESEEGSWTKISVKFPKMGNYQKDQE